jgi:uncharacterized protein with GYD domain
MAIYLIQAAYTAEGWATMTKNPQDRSKPFSELAQKLGGRLIGVNFSFEEYEVVALIEACDDIATYATSMAVVPPGYIKAIKTTRLFTVEETMEAMRKAGSITFQGPSRG